VSKDQQVTRTRQQNKPRSHEHRASNGATTLNSRSRRRCPEAAAQRCASALEPAVLVWGGVCRGYTYHHLGTTLTHISDGCRLASAFIGRSFLHCCVAGPAEGSVMCGVSVSRVVSCGSWDVGYSVSSVLCIPCTCSGRVARHVYV